MLSTKNSAFMLTFALMFGPLNVSATGNNPSASPVISGQIQRNGLTAQQANEVLIMVLKH